MAQGRLPRDIISTLQTSNPESSETWLRSAGDPTEQHTTRQTTSSVDDPESRKTWLRSAGDPTEQHTIRQTTTSVEPTEAGTGFKSAGDAIGHHTACHKSTGFADSTTTGSPFELTEARTGSRSAGDTLEGHAPSHMSNQRKDDTGWAKVHARSTRRRSSRVEIRFVGDAAAGTGTVSRLARGWVTCARSE
jgi:hypothetical protein